MQACERSDHGIGRNDAPDGVVGETAFDGLSERPLDQLVPERAVDAGADLSGWLERLCRTQLYRYVLPEESFESLHDHGAHVSRETVVPMRVEPMGDLLALLTEADVELRLSPSLGPLAQTMMKTTLHWSLIRMRNARGWQGS